jgi:Tfp pilus assembly protein PilO
MGGGVMTLLKSTAGYSLEARKGMAIIALLAAVLVVLVYLLFAWHSAASDRLRQAEAEHQMVAARAAKAMRDGATRLTAADDVAPMFLDGATPGLAFAKFQSIAGEAAQRAGLAVKRMQPVDTGDAGAAAPYRLSVDAEGSIEQVRAFLADIESTLPIMFITGLEVQPAAAAGEGDAYPSEALRMTFRVEAYGWRAQP